MPDLRNLTAGQLLALGLAMTVIGVVIGVWIGRL